MYYYLHQIKDFPRNLMFFFKNIWTFRKSLWDYRPWDSHHCLSLYKESLEDLRDAMEKHDKFEYTHKYVKRLSTVILLLDRVLEENYIGMYNHLERYRFLKPKENIPKSEKEILKMPCKQAKNDLEYAMKLISKYHETWWD